MEFAYDGGGLAKGGDVTLYYDGQPVGTGRVENTQPMIFSSGERDGGREPTATSGPVSTPATSYAWVSSESATIASSERPHRARR